MIVIIRGGRQQKRRSPTFAGGCPERSPRRSPPSYSSSAASTSGSRSGVCTGGRHVYRMLVVSGLCIYVATSNADHDGSRARDRGRQPAGHQTPDGQCADSGRGSSCVRHGTERRPLPPPPTLPRTRQRGARRRPGPPAWRVVRARPGNVARRRPRSTSSRRSRRPHTAIRAAARSTRAASKILDP
jgi:hypothetical protein